jgi:multiple sugar transport system permease protein
MNIDAGITRTEAPGLAIPKTRSTLRRREAVTGYLFILPAVLGFILWTAGPMVYSFWMSLHEWDLLTSPEWVGFGNYRDMWDDPLFWKSLRVTFYFLFVSVPLFQLISFGVALLLNVRVRGISFFRTAYYLPTIVPLVASSVLWAWVFNSEFGLLNALLRKVGISKILWLQDPTWAMPALIVMSLWVFGGTMIIYLAGLQGIPQHLYEAAELDGAGEWNKLINITIPMMSPVIFFNLVLGLIGSLQTFTQAYVITNGGPQNSTLFYALYIYRRAFTDFKMGYASALAWVLFGIVLVFSILVFRSFGRMVYYEDEAT